MLALMHKVLLFNITIQLWQCVFDQNNAEHWLVCADVLHIFSDLYIKPELNH